LTEIIDQIFKPDRSQDAFYALKELITKSSIENFSILYRNLKIQVNFILGKLKDLWAAECSRIFDFEPQNDVESCKFVSETSTDVHETVVFVSSDKNQQVFDRISVFFAKNPILKFTTN